MPVTSILSRSRFAAFVAARFRAGALTPALPLLVTLLASGAAVASRGSGSEPGLPTAEAVAAASGEGARALARRVHAPPINRPGGKSLSWYRRVSRRGQRLSQVDYQGPLVADSIDVFRASFSGLSVVATRPPRRPIATADWPARATRAPPQKG